MRFTIHSFATSRICVEHCVLHSDWLEVTHLLLYLCIKNVAVQHVHKRKTGCQIYITYLQFEVFLKPIMSTKCSAPTNTPALQEEENTTDRSRDAVAQSEQQWNTLESIFVWLYFGFFFIIIFNFLPFNTINRCWSQQDRHKVEAFCSH